MKNFKSYFVAFTVFAFALVPMLTIGQTPIGGRIIYPPEFSPLIASRPPSGATVAGSAYQVRQGSERDS